MRSIIAIFVAMIAVPAAAQLSQPFPYPEPASPGVIRHTHGTIETDWLASSDAYRYSADLNVSFDFGGWKGAHFNVGGGILTLIKHTNEHSFQPDKYRGTIEPSIYWPRGNNVLILSVRHQSFHTIDRPRDDRESYELYNVGYQRRGDPNFRLTAGKYEHRIDNHYDWDFLAQVDTACLGGCGIGKFYASGIAHYVTESGNPTGRSNFFDYSLEGGIQTVEGIRYFTSYRQIHDIDRVNGITDNELLFGLRFMW